MGELCFGLKVILLYLVKDSEVLPYIYADLKNTILYP